MESCATCNHSLDSSDDGTAVGCDRCPAWFHSSCTSIKKDELKALKNPGSELMWFCPDCKDNGANSSTVTGRYIAGLAS